MRLNYFYIFRVTNNRFVPILTPASPVAADWLSLIKSLIVLKKKIIINNCILKYWPMCERLPAFGFTVLCAIYRHLVSLRFLLDYQREDSPIHQTPISAPMRLCLRLWWPLCVWIQYIRADSLLALKRKMLRRSALHLHQIEFRCRHKTSTNQPTNQPIRFDRNVCHFNLHFGIYCSCSSFYFSQCAHEREIALEITVYFDLWNWKNLWSTKEFGSGSTQNRGLFADVRLLFIFFHFVEIRLADCLNLHSYRMLLQQQYRHIFVFHFTWRKRRSARTQNNQRRKKNRVVFTKTLITTVVCRQTHYNHTSRRFNTQRSFFPVRRSRGVCQCIHTTPASQPISHRLRFTLFIANTFGRAWAKFSLSCNHRWH